MHIKKIQIQNIRSISELVWEIKEDQAAGWHVILGNNGSGKSSFVRSVALTLLGPAEIFALRQDWNHWLRFNTDKGIIYLNFLYSSEVDWVEADEEEASTPIPFPNQVFEEQHRNIVRQVKDKIYGFPSVNVTFDKLNEIGVFPRWEKGTERYDPFNSVWRNSIDWSHESGWFSCIVALCEPACNNVYS